MIAVIDEKLLNEQGEIEKYTNLLDLEREYTVDEFLELDTDEEYELIGGKLVPRDPLGRSGRHGIVATNIGYELIHYIRNLPNPEEIGVISIGSPCRLKATKRDFVVPDVCLIPFGSVPEMLGGPIVALPKLVVEVNSPTDTCENIYNKIKGYQIAGVPLIWSVYAVEGFAVVYRLGNPERRFLQLNDEFDGEEIIPGFKMPLAKVV